MGRYEIAICFGIWTLVGFVIILETSKVAFKREWKQKKCRPLVIIGALITSPIAPIAFIAGAVGGWRRRRKR
jgi:hypothetical protein